MTLSQLREQKPHIARSWEYAIEKRMGLKKAAARLRLHHSTLARHITQARALFAGATLLQRGVNRDWDAFDARLVAHGRCSCGLLKPCDCEEVREEILTARRGPGPAYPAGVTW